MSFSPAGYCADVQLASGETLNGVPVLGIYGPSYGQDLTWTHNLLGTTVVLLWVEYQYFILGPVPTQQLEREQGVTVNVTEQNHGGTNESTYGKTDVVDFTSNRATDFYQSDKILRSGTDTEVSLWREGVARIKAGPLAQLILGKFKDFARLIARNFQFYSDFGEVEVSHNPEGRVSLHLHGGADFKNEAHPVSQKWTIQAWLGDNPEDSKSRLHIRVNNEDNSEFVTMQYDIEGTHKFETSKDDEQTIGNDRTHNILNDETIVVANNAVRNVLGTWNINVSGDVNLTSGTSIKLHAPTVHMN